MCRTRRDRGRRALRSESLSVLALEGRALLSASPRIDLFDTPNPRSEPMSIVDGPGGALWFTPAGDEGLGGISRIDPTGLITEFAPATPAGGSSPQLFSPTDGPDDAIWAIDGANSRIDRIAPDGRVTSFAIPGGPSTDAFALVTGTDGNLWFTAGSHSYFGQDDGPGSVDRITPAGVITAFPLPAGAGVPVGLVATPGGVWFTDPSASRVGRVDESGHVVEYAAPSPSTSLAIGTDGDPIYYVRTANAFVLIDVAPDGSTRPIYLPGAVESNPVTGPGGLYYLGEDSYLGTIELDRLDPDGVVETIVADTGLYANQTPPSLAFGPDGNLYVTLELDEQIGRFVLTPTPPPSANPTIQGVGGAVVLAPIGRPSQLHLANYLASANVTDLATSIDWGDGSAPTVAAASGYDVFPDANFRGSVDATHTYAAAGSYTVTVAIRGAGPGGTPVSATVVDPLRVVATAPIAHASPFVDARAATAFAGPVAVFTASVSDDIDSPTDTAYFDAAGYAATIDWGDGSPPTAGTVGFYSAPFSHITGAVSRTTPYAVSGTHTYASTGSYAIRASLTDRFGHTLVESTEAQIVAGTLAFDPAPEIGVDAASVIDAGTGPQDPVILGMLDDLPGSTEGRAVTATVDWGDGTAPTAASLVQTYLSDFGGHNEPGPIDVEGNHLYARAGTYAATVTVLDAQGDSDRTTAVVTATAGDPSRYLKFVGVTASDPIPPTTLAFIDAAPGSSLASYAATIDWGDGTAPTAGVVEPGPASDRSPSGFQFTVTGEHTYETAGYDPVSVTVVGPGGTTSTVQVAWIGAAPAGISSMLTPTSPVFAPGVSGPPVPLARFSSTAGSTTGDLLASVDWGDGSPVEAATVQAVGLGGDGLPGDQVVGGHAYAVAGHYQIKITVVGRDTIPVVIFDQADVSAAPIIPPTTPPVVPPTTPPAPVMALPPPEVEPFDPIVLPDLPLYLPSPFPSFAPKVAKHPKAPAHHKAAKAPAHHKVAAHPAHHVAAKSHPRGPRRH